MGKCNCTPDDIGLHAANCAINEQPHDKPMLETETPQETISSPGMSSDIQLLKMALGNTAACLGDALALYNNVVGREAFKNSTPPSATHAGSDWVAAAAEATGYLVARRGFIPWTDDPNDPTGGKHVEGMLVKLKRGEITGHKAHRWLGWVQACAAMRCGITLEEFKSINKKASADRDSTQKGR